MDERTRILKLVESGVITAEEAISLLEKLSQEKAPQQNSAPVVEVADTTPLKEQPKPEAFVGDGEPFEPSTAFGQNDDTTEEQAKQEKRTTGFEDIFGKAFNNKKMDDVFNDIRKDVTDFSERMMTFMNTTLSRVKSGEVPFGEKVELEQSFAYPSADVKAFEIDIPNGKVEFVEGTDEQVVISAFVKAPAVKQENEEAGEQFFDGFVELKDGKIEVSTPSKLAYVELTISAPRKTYDVVITKLLSGGVSFNSIDAKLLKAKTYNGAIKYFDGKFDHADFQTVNGSIEVNEVEGTDLEANTANGRISIDGKLKEVDAESANGYIVVTTKTKDAHKLKASTLAGSVELYVPKMVSLEGVGASNFGKVDVQLDGAQVKAEDDQFLRKTVRFNKIVEDAKLLKINAESRTGGVIVRYTGLAE